MNESGSNTSSFCGNCGHFMQGNERFCGNCGRNVSGTSSEASSAVASDGRRSPMFFIGIAMISVAIFAVGGIVLFGDRLGFAGDAPGNSEPPRLLESTERDEPTEEEPTKEEPTEEEQAPETAETPEPQAETPQEQSEEETFEQEFITRYYDAVAERDWYTTYSLLASSSQAEFTESEWVAAQEARVSATNPPTLESATVQDVLGEAAGFVADILLVYTDGTNEVVPVQAVLEEDGLKRYLTAEEISYLRGLVGETDTEDPGSGFAEAAEQFVYEYYTAVAAEDWSATYSMLDYGGQAAFTESEWVERQMVRQAVSGAPSSVVDVSISAPEFYPPIATATVTFASGEVVEITVVDPHSQDGQYDRVLTPDEIAYLQGL